MKPPHRLALSLEAKCTTPAGCCSPARSRVSCPGRCVIQVVRESGSFIQSCAATSTTSSPGRSTSTAACTSATLVTSSCVWSGPNPTRTVASSSVNSVFSTEIGCRWLAYAKNRGTRPRAFTQTFTPCDATVSAFARCQAPGSPGSHSMPAIALTGSVEITRRARLGAAGAGHDRAVRRLRDPGHGGAQPDLARDVRRDRLREPAHAADDPVGGRCLVHELPVPARRGRPAQRARQADLVEPGVHVPRPHCLIRAARLVVEPERVEPVLDAESVQPADLAGRRVNAPRDGGADVIHDRLLSV